jgi:vinculin
MTDALCELRQDGKGTTPQAECLAHSIQEKLGQLCELVQHAVIGVEKSGMQQPAHTVSGRLEQARRWLAHPDRDDRGLGQQAIALIVAEGKKVADGLPGIHKAEILGLCDEVDILSRQLSDLCRRGHGDTPQAQEVARTLSQKLYELKDRIQNAVVSRVVEDFIDISTPLKQFTDAVHVPQGTPGREQNFNDRAQQLQQFSTRAAKTARMVAAGGSSGNKKLAEALLSSASQVESLTPQLVSAGRIRMNYPESKAADEHFQNLVAQYSDSVQHVRALCDEATDSADFIRMSEEQIQKHTILCEESIRKNQPQKMVDNTASIARLANRVLMVAKQESDNSEDPQFIARVNSASDQVQASVTPMVQDAKAVAINTQDTVAMSRWRESNRALLNAVSEVRHAVTVTPDLPPPPDMTDLRINEYAPPRPPLPGGEVPPPRPPPPETDDEDDMFRHAPLPNQPIMMAAHGLHQEVRQWSSKDNDIIVAAKKMAVLMGRLSQLVRGEGGSSKRDLISCAKSIAEASEEVTRLAKELARECTDKRMRTNLLQVCERIPTIGTQLKILSTVKATMLGAQGTEEDQEATDMLVGNAQNLMQSVKETVRAAESASIKIRTDAGIRLRWVRRQPWYQY